MSYGSMYMSYAGGVEILPTLQSISPERLSVSGALESSLNVMSVSMLAEYCVEEVRNLRHGAIYDESYCLELFRRVTLQSDQLAWECLQQVFCEIVRSWMRLHPSREMAYRLDSEENYVAQAFERFWQATTQNRKLEFRTVAVALQYLRASLNSAVLDTLRVHSRHKKEAALPEPGFPGEPMVEGGSESSKSSECSGCSESSERWEILKEMLHDEREQRLAYLLFHCGLKPREIVHFCPQEFNDVHEIYRLRCNIIERLQRNT